MAVELLLREGEIPDLIVGAVRAGGVVPGPAPDPLAALLDAAVARFAADQALPPEPVKKAVRDLLRQFGYRPAGRGKPASEYLAGAACKGDFPRIDALVDINNLVSLQTGLPISMLDLGRFEGSPRLRVGRAGERYVFNSAGQEIELQGLLVVCDGDVPRGSPVKDSMATKVGPETRSVLAVIYGSTRVCAAVEMERHVASLAALLRAHAGAAELATQVL